MTAASDAQNTITQALMEVTENMQPVIEACEGQRKQLEERGWSPTAAEKYALELLLSITKSAFGR